MMPWVLVAGFLALAPAQDADPPAAAPSPTGEEAPPRRLVEGLDRLYRDRLRRLEGILARLEAGGRPDPGVVGELVEEPREKAELEMEFERRFLAGIRRARERRERLRKEPEIAAAPKPEGPAGAQAIDVAPAGPREDSGNEEIGEATLSGDRILGSLYPEALGDLLFSRGRYGEAVQAYRVVPHDGKDAHAERISYRLAQSLERAGRFAEAEAAFREVSTRFPKGRFHEGCALHLEILEIEEQVRATLASGGGGTEPGDGKGDER